MEQKYFLKIYFCLLTLLLTNISFSQTTLYSENFTNQNGKGIAGTDEGSPTTNLSGVDWTIDCSDCNLTATSDYFQVVNERFEGRDVDGTAIWYSAITTLDDDYVDISISLSANYSGNNPNLEPSDLFETYYSINGGNWTLFENNGSLPGSFVRPANVSQTGLILNEGNTIQVKVEITNNGGGERHRLDNVLIEGTAAPSNTYVTFTSSKTSITETNSDIVTGGIPISVTNYGTDIITVTPTINASSTSETEDYTIDLTQIVFNSNGIQNIPLTIKSDADNLDETIVINFTVTSDSGTTIGTSSHIVEISDNEIPKIVINEINYNSIGADDEWIEIYNAEGSDVDISGWIIENNTNSFNGTFTFPSNTIISSGQYKTIAFGSDGDGNFNDENPFTPDFTNLAVNNVSEIADTNDTGHISDVRSTFYYKNLLETLLTKYFTIKET